MATKRVKTGGRQAGTPNKMTATVKEMILKALDAVGGQEWLVEQAKANPTAFMSLLAKILPSQLSADIHGSAPVTYTIKRIIVDARNREVDDQES